MWCIWFISFRTAGCLLVALALVLPCYSKDCPEPNPSLKSHGSGPSVDVEFHNLSAEDLMMYWVDDRGEEHSVGIIDAEGDEGHQTYSSHVFRARRIVGSRQLVGEYVVERRNREFNIVPCGSIKVAQEQYLERDQEFKALSQHHLTACGDNIPSSQWSCFRCINEREFKGRIKGEYGFTAEEAAAVDGARVEGEQTDSSYIQQIPYIRKLTAGGYLRMNMTDKMTASLLPWYKEKRNAGAVVYDEVVGGGYTNSELKPFGKIDLDLYPEVRAVLVGEMKQVLQWWTNQSLRHTATYGVRVYPRDAILINHVDREDTHLASAVLQVDQLVDKEGGWPLEVLTPSGYPCEVYLQPGEMVLYEGARIKHGRPMRFNGDEFANIFSHFKPKDWTGTHELQLQSRIPKSNAQNQSIDQAQNVVDDKTPTQEEDQDEQDSEDL